METGRPEESVGTEMERRENEPAERMVILTDTQEAGGSGWQQGQSPGSDKKSETDSSVVRARLRLSKTGF